SAGNLGGGGFMLVRLADGTTTFLDFRECAPQKATRDMYLGPDGEPTRDSIYGWRSSGVPGSVSGFWEAHKKFGSKPWADLLAPAIKLARDGFVLSGPVAASVQSAQELKQHPESKRIFLRNGDYYKPGETFSQPELAETLDRIAKHGAQDFYDGETAHRLAAAMAAHGGLITVDDLKAYKTIERKPLMGEYKGFHILTAPPPSAGGIGLLQVMGILTGTHYDSDGPNSTKAVHYEAEAMRRFYADRSEYLGDPDFYVVPVKPLLDPAYVGKRRGTIDPNHATPSDLVEPGLPKAMNAGISWYESTETTHFNVVDSHRNAVAVTYTLNNSYGNGITAPGLGFLLNDEMGLCRKTGRAEHVWDARRKRKCHRARQTPCVIDDTNHHYEERQVVYGRGRPRRVAHYNWRDGGDSGPDRLSYESAGCGGSAALPRAMEAGHSLS